MLITMYPDEVVNFHVQCSDPTYLLTSALDILAPGKKNVPKPLPTKNSQKKKADTESQVNVNIKLFIFEKIGSWTLKFMEY